MKHKCIISRLNEPHIARIYVLDFDQNLINNIRVLCTKSPETVRYFVPEELFLELRNGYPVPMTAECRDHKGKRVIPVDPLKVLSEQLRDAPGAIPDPEGLEIRVYVEGYILPVPEEGMGFLKRTPRREPWLAANKPSESGGYASAKAHEPSGSDRYSYNSSHTKASASYDQGQVYSESDILRAPLRRSTVITAIAAAFLILAAVGFWFMKDASIRRFDEMMRMSKYSEAVMIYNEKILGHPSREAKADPQIESAVSAIESGYLSETLGYEEARRKLGVLTGIGKSELSEIAQSTLDGIEVFEQAAELYTEGLESIGNGDYVNAIRVFSALQGYGQSSEKAQETVPALPSPYKDSQDRLTLCVDRLVKSCVGIRSEDEYPDASAKIEAAIGFLPENEQLLEAREACRSKYGQLVIQNAVSAADEKIVEDDFSGAFKVLAEAQEKLPGDERLEEKMSEYRQAFVAYITKEVCGKVDGGDTEKARSILKESQEVLECEELDLLLSQVQAVVDRQDPDPRVYTAGKCKESEFKGAVRKKGQKDSYKVKAEESGPHRFLLSKVTYGLAVRMIIYAQDGSEIYNSGVVGSVSSPSGDGDSGKGSSTSSGTSGRSGTGISGSGDSTVSGDITVSGSAFSGSESTSSSPTAVTGSNAAGGAQSPAAETGPTAGDSATCRLDEGKSYTVEIEAVGGKGSYILTVRHQKPPVEITDYDVIRDRMEFVDQQTAYSFTAGQNGVYRIDLTDAEKLSGLRVDVYDAAGAKSDGGVIANGEGLTVRLESGEDYEIRISQPAKTGEYTLRIGKPSPPEDITGKNIAAGTITYTGQRNVYKYTAGEDGRFCFTIGNLRSDSSMGLDIYDSLGFEIGGEDSIRNSGSVTAELESGQTYEILVTQRKGGGDYTLTVCEDE